MNIHLKKENVKFINYKRVYAYGLYFRIPYEFKYIAIDYNGDIFLFDSKPFKNINNNVWNIWDESYDYKYLGTVKDMSEINWEESLIEV